MGQVSQALLDSHLAGTARVGAHSTNRRDEAKWFVIDLDGLSVVAVQDIIAVSKRETVPVAVEASKSPGRFHIWGFFADLVPAWKGRALGRALVKAAGWDNRGIEIFPKQDSLMGTDKQLGNFLWLPWHGVDLPRGRTAFLDTTKEQWHPFPDQVGYLMALERIPL